jgi:hypothetical protein
MLAGVMREYKEQRKVVGGSVVKWASMTIEQQMTNDQAPMTNKIPMTNDQAYASGPRHPERTREGSRVPTDTRQSRSFASTLRMTGTYWSLGLGHLLVIGIWSLVINATNH